VPVIKIPLKVSQRLLLHVSSNLVKTDHAAPTTDRPMQRPMPMSAHAYGEIDSRNWPTC
jgi:hypothetical protein